MSKAEFAYTLGWLRPACRNGVMQMASSSAQGEGAAPAGEKKLWGGRFTGQTDPLMEKFNESLPFDKRMWAEDLKVRRGSKDFILF